MVSGVRLRASPARRTHRHRGRGSQRSGRLGPAPPARGSCRGDPAPRACVGWRGAAPDCRCPDRPRTGPLDDVLEFSVTRSCSQAILRCCSATSCTKVSITSWHCARVCGLRTSTSSASSATGRVVCMTVVSHLNGEPASPTLSAYRSRDDRFCRSKDAKLSKPLSLPPLKEPASRTGWLRTRLGLRGH